jgi:hypothetical protein
MQLKLTIELDLNIHDLAYLINYYHTNKMKISNICVESMKILMK